MQLGNKNTKRRQNEDTAQFEWPEGGRGMVQVPVVVGWRRPDCPDVIVIDSVQKPKPN
jgi:hypothetical protein